MKVSLHPDSRGNPANRPSLCINCVLWRASQKCSRAQFFVSFLFLFLSFFFLPLWQVSEIKCFHKYSRIKRKTSVSCNYYQINTIIWTFQCIQLLNIFLVVSSSSVISDPYVPKKTLSYCCKRCYRQLIYRLWCTCLVHFVLLQFYRPRWVSEAQFYLYWPISFWCLFKENGLHSFYTVWMCISPCFAVCTSENTS